MKPLSWKEALAELKATVFAPVVVSKPLGTITWSSAGEPERSERFDRFVLDTTLDPRGAHLRHEVPPEGGFALPTLAMGAELYADFAGAFAESDEDH